MSDSRSQTPNSGDSGKHTASPSGWLTVGAVVLWALLLAGTMAYYFKTREKAVEESTKPLQPLSPECQSAEIIDEKTQPDLQLPPPECQSEEKVVITLSDGVRLEMKRLKGGSFIMGCNPKERRYADANQHQVTITQDFWLGVYEVTQEQWRAVMGEHHFSHIGDQNPVNFVSWDDAEEFCEKLNHDHFIPKPLGYHFALPTEAQWEYACRAGTTTALNSGKASDRLAMEELGWWRDNCDGSTHPVGQKRPNAWGFYDMHGNVREWCRDSCVWDNGVHTDTYDGTQIDPLCTIGQERVLRGGDLMAEHWECHSGFRYAAPRSRYSQRTGFRIALVPEENSSALFLDGYGAFAEVPQEYGSFTFDGENLHFDKVKLEMKRLAAGSFMMGSPEEEKGHFKDETQHQVTITQDFWLGVYEVTQEQWQAVMGSNPLENPHVADYPVANVSWKDAKAFCERLNGFTSIVRPDGYRFDLPTEAQWEYACRAGTTTALGNGKNLTSARGACPNMDEMGWYYKNSGQTVHPVGQKRPNAWGFYDMHGNVAEWCRDSCHVREEAIEGTSYLFQYVDTDTYNGFQTDPLSSSGAYRIFRGGRAENSAQLCRSARRESRTPDAANDHIGFRLALVPSQQ